MAVITADQLGSVGAQARRVDVDRLLTDDPRPARTGGTLEATPALEASRATAATPPTR